MHTDRREGAILRNERLGRQLQNRNNESGKTLRERQHGRLILDVLKVDYDRSAAFITSAPPWEFTKTTEDRATPCNSGRQSKKRREKGSKVYLVKANWLIVNEPKDMVIYNDAACNDDVTVGRRNADGCSHEETYRKVRS